MTKVQEQPGMIPNIYLRLPYAFEHTYTCSHIHVYTHVGIHNVNYILHMKTKQQQQSGASAPRTAGHLEPGQVWGALYILPSQLQLLL